MCCLVLCCVCVVLFPVCIYVVFLLLCSVSAASFSSCVSVFAFVFLCVAIVAPVFVCVLPCGPVIQGSASCFFFSLFCVASGVFFHVFAECFFFLLLFGVSVFWPCLFLVYFSAMYSSFMHVL